LMDDALKDQFRRVAIVHGEGTETGDNQKSNEAYDREVALVKEMRLLSDRGRALLSSLLSDSDAAVRSSAASCLLPLDESTTIPILEHVARSTLPLVGPSAEMVLREWRSGRLKIP
jgi:hypothetical protein